jgi:putative beta-lysine N-acetyltransferase
MDTVENLNDAVIQHGPHNDRIYLMRLKTTDPRNLLTALDKMAQARGYGKICAKIPEAAWPAFQSAGYVKEAVIPGFFAKKSAGLFVAKFFSAQRQKAPLAEKQVQTILQSDSKRSAQRNGSDEGRADIVACQVRDAEVMSRVYQQVFKSYPFPIQDPAHLEHMIAKGTRYVSIRVKGKITAVAAAEIDLDGSHTEMTDFATLAQWRGRGFAGMLLRHLHHKTREMGIATAYTIARAAAPGMNFVFKNSGYTYGGLLANNSQICGGIESMTVWYRHL